MGFVKLEFRGGVLKACTYEMPPNLDIYSHIPSTAITLAYVYIIYQ
jgi:hypothetical protein